MEPGDGTEPIADNEIVFRRVSDRSGWYDASSDRPVAWEAFRPNQQDQNDISVWRAKYLSASAVAAWAARAGRLYYVYSLRVGSLRAAGIIVEPTPQEGGSGHASLVNLSNRAYAEDKNLVRELAEKIATLVQRVEGPFGPFKC